MARYRRVVPMRERSVGAVVRVTSQTGPDSFEEQHHLKVLQMDTTIGEIADWVDRVAYGLSGACQVYVTFASPTEKDDG